MIQAITIEREFGCGGSAIASLLAQRLGWKLWDHELTEEIARLTNSTPQAVEKREWKDDPAVYRVFKSFLRGAFEGALPPTDRLELLSGGPCVIVGRGAQYFFRNRKDVFRTFLYASRDFKIHRLISAGTPERDAIEQVDTVDRDRAEFVKKYLKLDWPDHHLYNAMFNTEMGESYVAEILAYCARRAS
jgi:cytidylate kinase